MAGGVETSLLGLAKALLQAMGSDLEPELGPARPVNGVTRRLADTSAARRDLGFVAEIDLDEGLRRLVDWWRSQPQEPRSSTRVTVASPVSLSDPASSA